MDKKIPGLSSRRHWYCRRLAVGLAAAADVAAADDNDEVATSSNIFADGRAITTFHEPDITVP